AAVFATGAAHSLPVPAAVGALEGAQLELFRMLGHPPAVGLAVGLAVRLREGAWIVPGILYLLLRPPGLRRRVPTPPGARAPAAAGGGGLAGGRRRRRAAAAAGRRPHAGGESAQRDRARHPRGRREARARERAEPLLGGEKPGRCARRGVDRDAREAREQLEG